MKLEQLAEKKVVIFSHYATTGAPDELRDWLLKIKVKELVYVAFPFGSNKDSFIRVELYKRGELQGTHRSWFRWKMREPLNYAKDILYAMYYSLLHARDTEVLAAGDNLLTMAGVLTRGVTRIRYLVYFMLDYTPVRFRNKFLNETYYAVDRFAAYHADAVWPGASEVVTGRAKAGRLDERRVNWYAVPYGSHPQKECEQTESGRKRIVYLGDVVRNKGAELFVPMACELKKLVPDFRFTVIGGGKDLPALREEVRAAGLDDHFEICGFVDKIEDVVARLAGAGVAIAPYYPHDANNFTFFADPGKIKVYLGCWLPIVLTDVPPVAQELVREGAGRIARYDAEDFAREVASVLNDETYAQMRENARQMGVRYAWPEVFKAAFDRLT